MDAGYGADTSLRSETTGLGLAYVAGIQPNTSVWTRIEGVDGVLPIARAQPGQIGAFGDPAAADRGDPFCPRDHCPRVHHHYARLPPGVDSASALFARKVTPHRRADALEP